MLLRNLKDGQSKDSVAGKTGSIMSSAGRDSGHVNHHFSVQHKCICILPVSPDHNPDLTEPDLTEPSVPVGRCISTGFVLWTIFRSRYPAFVCGTAQLEKDGRRAILTTLYVFSPGASKPGDMPLLSKV